MTLQEKRKLLHGRLWEAAGELLDGLNPGWFGVREVKTGRDDEIEVQFYALIEHEHEVLPAVPESERPAVEQFMKETIAEETRRQAFDPPAEVDIEICLL